MGILILLAIVGLVAWFIVRQRQKAAAELAAVVDSVVPVPPGTQTLAELPADHPLIRALLWWTQRRGLTPLHNPGHPYWNDAVPYDDRWYWLAKGRLEYTDGLRAESARRHDEWLNSIAVHNQPLYFAVQQWWQQERHQAEAIAMQQAQLATQQKIARAARDTANSAGADRRYYDNNGNYVGRSSSF